MRHREPRAARELLESCAARELADKRVQLVEVLSINLSDEDADYLKILVRIDLRRSSTSIWLAGSIGQSSKEVDEVLRTSAGLAAGYQLKTSKRQEIGFDWKLKSKTQRSIRTRNLQLVPLYAFAKKLDIDLAQLLQSWRFDKNHPTDNEHFIVNGVNTSPMRRFLLLENFLDYLCQEEGGPISDLFASGSAKKERVKR